MSQPHELPPAFRPQPQPPGPRPLTVVLATLVAVGVVVLFVVTVLVDIPSFVENPPVPLPVAVAPAPAGRASGAPPADPVEAAEAAHRVTMDKLRAVRLALPEFEWRKIDGKRTPCVTTRVRNGLDRPVGKITGWLSIVWKPDAPTEGRIKPAEVDFELQLQKPIAPGSAAVVVIPFAEDEYSWTDAASGDLALKAERAYDDRGDLIVDVETTLQPLLRAKEERDAATQN